MFGSIWTRLVWNFVQTDNFLFDIIVVQLTIKTKEVDASSIFVMVFVKFGSVLRISQNFFFNKIVVKLFENAMRHCLRLQRKPQKTLDEWDKTV